MRREYRIATNVFVVVSLFMLLLPGPHGAYGQDASPVAQVEARSVPLASPRPAQHVADRQRVSNPVPVADNSAGPIPAATAAVSYTIIDLGEVADHIASGTGGMNPAGQVVGASAMRPNTITGTQHAYSWSQAAGVQDLFAQGCNLGGSESFAHSINSYREVVGSARDTQGILQAYLWKGGAITRLFQGDGISKAFDINDSGEVVGTVQTAAGFRSFLWTARSGGMALPGFGGGNSVAKAINTFGQVTGYSELPGVDIYGYVLSHAYLWDRAVGVPGVGGVRDLQAGCSWCRESMGLNINDAAQVVGSASNTTDWNQHAFIYTGTAMVDLNAPSWFSSQALAINNAGQVVGYYVLNNGIINDRHAFLYEKGLVHDLTDLLPPGSGWEWLLYASDINDAGEIVGVGIVNNILHIFLMKPTATAADIRVTDIEVTQSIQDLDNNVPLVANKRTVARVHVKSGNIMRNVTARLFAERNGVSLGPPLTPANPGGKITVQSRPSRGLLNDSFYFELPADWIQAGEIVLRAEVNPDHSVPETDYTNNIKTTGTLAFLQTNILRLRLVNFEYKRAGVTISAQPLDQALLESQLRRMYPAQVDVKRLSVDGTGFLRASGVLTPTANLVNLVSSFYRREIYNGDLGAAWYGMVSDAGGFMRGEAMGIGSWVASGPTGVPARQGFGWDLDGSYGDWYGAHEIGHMLGRWHVWCAGDEGNTDAAYPYPLGKIGGSGSASDQFYGFDVGDGRLGIAPTVIPNSWTDVMSYCPNEWISDYTYTGIRDYIQNNFAPAAIAPGSPAPAAISGDFLSIYGTINLTAQTASLPFLARQSTAAEAPPLIPGPYHIRLIGAGNALLADYPFTPQRGTDGWDTNTIAQVVNFVAGTQRVAIYSDIVGRELGSVPVSSNAPVVSSVSHTGGASLPPGGPVTLNWIASDADGDSLTYMILYSPDNRAAWDLLGSTSAMTLEVDAANLRGTGGASTGYFRVIANDGALTGSADDGPITVSQHAPVAQIFNPTSGSTYVISQTLVLEGQGQDLEDETLADANLIWSSSLDGPLGSGSLINPTGLSLGAHTITLTVTDSDGLTGTAMITATIVSSLTPTDNRLSVAPDTIEFIYHPQDPEPRAQSLALRTLGTDPITWTLVSDAPWIIVSDVTGTVPADVLVRVDTTLLPDQAEHEGHLAISTVGGTIEQKTIVVRADLRPSPGGVFAEFPLPKLPLPDSLSLPRGITAGPDGALWFTESDANKIGRITPDGALREYALPTPESHPEGIVAGPDGALWFAEDWGLNIGRITLEGTITEFPIPRINGSPVHPSGITVGPDGALWFTGIADAGWIGRLTTGGTFTLFPLSSSDTYPREITTGPDGALWFTARGYVRNEIGRITTGGMVITYPLPTPNVYLEGITAGPDGNLWFTEANVFGGDPSGRIGRITPNGVITEFPVPSGHRAWDITTGPDGNLWFTPFALVQGEHTCPAGNWIGRITVDGAITEFQLPEPTNLGSQPFAIVTGPDKQLWFTELGSAHSSFCYDKLRVSAIGRLNPTGALMEFVLPRPDSHPRGISTDQFGRVWIAMAGGGSSGSGIASTDQNGQITTYDTPSGSSPWDITSTPGGGACYVSDTSNGMGCTTPVAARAAAGLTITGPLTITEFTIPTPDSQPRSVTWGPDNALWFVEYAGNKVGRMTLAGVFTEYPIPTPGSGPQSITNGPDGALWFTEAIGNRIGRITTDGLITEYPLPMANSYPQEITSGPDGALWFTEAIGKIGRITTAGVITEFSLPDAGSNPQGIVAGRNGALWFTEAEGNKIGWITLDGAITEYPVPTDNATPLGIAAGPDGSIWFTQYNANKIGQGIAPQPLRHQVFLPIVLR